MTGIATMEELTALFRSQGVRTAYVKLLSGKQDNSKNQIYLGRRLDGATNLFPAVIEARSPSQSVRKRKSLAGHPKLEARLDFAWLSGDGARTSAPHTRIIDYFQYPEVRLSGFLRGTRGKGPEALIRKRQAEFGQRILVIGTAADGKVVGVVLTARDDPLVATFPELPLAFAGGVLRALVIGAPVGASPDKLLHDQITAIVRHGWHGSQINRGGTIEAFRGPQGGGYTLEALLGVAANGDKKPDIHGFEIKSYGGGRISLMTPAPDLGFQGSNNLRAFMERWGRPGRAADGSRRFTGLHRVGTVNAKTGLELRIRGYDRGSDSFSDPTATVVELVHSQTGEVAAGWSLDRLANCWNVKHASALYIRYRKREAAGSNEYHYASQWLIGRGTDVFRLIRAIDRGIVFYDPADSIYPDGKLKGRSQWRINAARLPAAMELLYASTSIMTVDDEPTEQ